MRAQSLIEAAKKLYATWQVEGKVADLNEYQMENFNRAVAEVEQAIAALPPDAVVVSKGAVERAYREGWNDGHDDNGLSENDGWLISMARNEIA